MQSKTSFFNKAVFRKNFTRFAPVWGLYTLALVMGLFIMVEGERFYQFGVNMTGLPEIMALINCGYALLTAQLLFGDLYQSRSCYALHSMPLRRETWYLTNVISGIVFSLIPTAVMTLVSLGMMSGTVIVGGWQIPLYVFVGVNLQYIFFFGLATLCSFCAGNRLGMVAIYGAVNFAAMGVIAMVEMLFIPLFFGVSGNSDAYLYLCPMVKMMNTSLLEIVDFTDVINLWYQKDRAYDLILEFTLGEGWGYYFSAAATGLVFMVGGLLLYRRRHLESAGDLLAVKVLEPVFQIVVTLASAAAFQMVYISFDGSSETQYDGIMGVVQSNAYYAFLAIGLVVGWFGGKMLLERSTSVFKKKNIPGLAALAAVAFLSLGICALDPMGISTWVPDPDEVESVAISESHHWGGTTLNEPGDKESLIQLHQLALSDRVTRKEVEDRDYANYDSFSVVYTLKNGKTARRYYNVWIDTEAGQLLKSFQTRPEVVLSDYEGTPLELDKLDGIYIQTRHGRNLILDEEDIPGFLDAVIADCEEGTMAGGMNYHQGYFIDEDDPEDPVIPTIEVCVNTNVNVWAISIYSDSRNTLQWVEEHDPDNRINYTVHEGDYTEAVKAWEEAHKVE